MFTTEERERVRAELIAVARSDLDVIGAALVGSAARGREDAWSDIDLALQLAQTADEPAVVARWTRLVRERFGVADTLDVVAPGGVRFRVFLLRSSLQLDLSFWPADQFRATEEGFAVLFGTPNEPTAPHPPDIDRAVGMGWLYALHARSALARGKLWQTVLMLDGLRDQVLELMCARNGLNAWHGREIDALPDVDRALLRQSRATDVSAGELSRSKRELLAAFLAEVEHHDVARADSLREPLAVLAEGSEPAVGGEMDP